MSEIVTIIRRTIDLDQTMVKETLFTLFATEDAMAHRFELTLERSGQALDLTGHGVAAYFTPKAGGVKNSIPIVGKIEDGKAVVTLEDTCYNHAGPFTLVIKVTKGEDRKAVYVCESSMLRSHTDELSDEGNVLDIDELLAEIADMEAATADGLAAAQEARDAAAEAAAAREAIQGDLSTLKDQIDEWNCIDYLPPQPDIAETVKSGVTFSCKNGVWQVTGTAAAPAIFSLLNSPNELPAWWTPGKTLRTVFDKTVDSTGMPLLRVYKYMQGGSLVLINDYDGIDSPYNYTVPEDFDGIGLQIRLHVPTGTSANATINKIAILNTLSNQEIIENLGGKASVESVVDLDMTPGRTDTVCGFGVKANKSEQRKLRKLILFGRTTQAGKPSQEQPVPLVNAAESGAVTVFTGGKNLLPVEEEITFDRRYRVTLDEPLPPGTYTISASIASNDTDADKCMVGFEGGSSTGGILYAELNRGEKNSDTVTLRNPSSSVFFNAGLDYAGSTGDTATYKHVQLEVGKSATEYEPYKDGESFTVNVPKSLAGILVVDGGNFVTNDGAQYVSDYVDFDAGEYVQMIGRIESYADENVGDVWMSTTGELSAGATVLYKLSQPIVTALDAEDTATYKENLRAHYPTTSVTNDGGAGISVSYAVIETEKDDRYVAPVSQAWEQRMLERIEQCVKPMVALRDLAKCNTGYTPMGDTLTGINYSAVHLPANGSNLVGIQVGLSTYYSALENPASKMYTEDNYQDDNSRSTYYGINCSGFVSYIIGAKTYLYTALMADMVADGTWSVVPVENENDLFKVKRGDILLNTVEFDGDDDHVALVRDVVYDAITGRLIGFNIAHSAKPYVAEMFFTLSRFLEWVNRDVQPYSVVRLDDVRREDGTYSLDVEAIKYSRSVYPDKGDGGRYAEGEEIQLYLPRASEAQSVTYTLDGAATTVYLSSMEASYVNEVKVYKLVLTDAGTYSIVTDSDPDDPCHVTVGE